MGAKRASRSSSADWLGLALMDEIDAKRIEDLKELANGAALDPGYWQTFGAAIRDLVDA